MSSSKVDHNSEKWSGRFATEAAAQAELEAKVSKFAKTKNIVSAKKKLLDRTKSGSLMYTFSIITAPKN